MNKVLIGFLCSVGFVAAVVATMFFYYVGVHNYAVSAEKEIVAAWEDNEQTLGQYTLKIQEMAQVPTMYKDDLKEVYTAAISGRYGEDGSQAMFQWLKEQNPNFDASMYTKLQQVMEAGRNEFKVKQTALIDRKRSYETNLDFFLKGRVLAFGGFPKIDLDDYKAITSRAAKTTFETGIDEGIKVR